MVLAPAIPTRPLRATMTLTWRPRRVPLVVVVLQANRTSDSLDSDTMQMPASPPTEDSH